MVPTIRVDDDVYKTLQGMAEPFVDSPNSVLRRVLELDASAEERQETRRATSDEILSRFEYDQPILEALAKRGGSARPSELLNDVGEMLKDRLKERDYERVPSGDIRWRNRAMWRRMRLIDEGFLKADTPRGVWELTEAGWERAKGRSAPD
jgi:hypothetical protein